MSPESSPGLQVGGEDEAVSMSFESEVRRGRIREFVGRVLRRRRSAADSTHDGVDTEEPLAEEATPPQTEGLGSIADTEARKPTYISLLSGISAFEVLDQGKVPIGGVRYITRGRSVAERSGIAFKLAGSIDGYGEHSYSGLQTAAGIAMSTILTRVSAVCVAFPEFFERTDDGLHIKEFSLLGRRPTQEEVDRHTELQQERTRLKGVRELGVVDRKPIMQYDHMLVGWDHKMYRMSLDNPEALLAAHVVRTLQAQTSAEANTAGLQVTRSGVLIADIVWQSMPENERALAFSDLNCAAARTPKVFRDEVLNILRGLTGRMGLTREPNRVGEFNINTSFSAAFEQNPRPHNTQEIPVFPPGTDKTQIQTHREEDMANLVVTDALIVRADGVVSCATDTRLDHGSAIDLLDFVVSRQGKNALRIAAERNGEELSQVLERAHTVIRASLGSNDAYWAACRQRMISGHTGTGGRSVRQTGGRVRGSNSATRWVFAGPYQQGRLRG